jgi:hypothetical protein
MDPVHRRYGPIPRVFSRKVILKILKLAVTLDFYKKNPQLFGDYILVPIIVHIGPCLSFYN